MAKKYVYNDTAEAIFVGGRMIPSGDGREVEVPDEPEDEKSDMKPDDDPELPQWPAELLELQKLSVAKLKERLPELKAEDLATLAQIEEKTETPRRTVLEAVTAAQLKLAGDKAGGGE